jgi:hypothetical protein
VRRIARETARYEGDARAWVQRLIPDVPFGMETAGARVVTADERENLRRLPTCADEIVEKKIAERQQEGAEPEGGEGGGEVREEQKNPGARSPTAFAEGVRFGALSAPGPSGLRPEHLKAFARCRRARSRHGYEGAMRKFVAAAVRGELPEACWWLTDTAVTLVQKPGATADAAPRPLRVGETSLRSSGIRTEICVYVHTMRKSRMLKGSAATIQHMLGMIDLRRQLLPQITVLALE